MAFLTDSIHLGRADRKPSIFIRILDALTQSRAAEARMVTYQRLNALSDADLQDIGLKRENLARYVFKDIYYV